MYIKHIKSAVMSTSRQH